MIRQLNDDQREAPQVRREWDGLHCVVCLPRMSLVESCEIGEIPFQLRRNQKPRGDRPLALKILLLLLRGRGEPITDTFGLAVTDLTPQEDKIAPVQQSPLKPARGKTAS